LDIREFAYWEGKAMRKNLLDRLGALTAARMAMTDDQVFSVEMMKIEWALKLLDKSLAEEYLEG
jgi:hypothetical protein